MKMERLRDKLGYQRITGYLKKNYPMIITIGRFAKQSLATLKNYLFGIGGIALLVIIGLYIAGALIEPARWYLIGTATALLILCGGVLTLSYIRFTINRLARDQRIQVSDINKQLSNINKQVSGLKKEISVIKDDVSLIGYDILKEQDKLAEKVSELETQASKDRKSKRPPKDSIE